MELHEPPPDYPYTRVLEEIAQAGYAGTELGPYGFLPTDPATLKKGLKQRRLTLCSAFVAMHLGDRKAHQAGFAHVTRTAELLCQVGCRVLILADEVTPERLAAAGRAADAAQHGWTEAEWEVAQQALSEVVSLCRARGLEVAFHHHVGTHVETPEEVDRFLALRPAEDFGLCLDTGHCLYGGGDPVEELKRYASRVRCLHFKDIDAGRLDEVRRQQLDFYDAVRHGVFALLGQGAVNLQSVVELLRLQEFDGWVVVEQDVLPGGRGATTPLENATAGREFLRTLGI
ncbi:MAG: TIM barrel protein [Terriglobia bacterium]